MQEIEFNLLTEPWVRVRLPDNPQSFPAAAACWHPAYSGS